MIGVLAERLVKKVTAGNAYGKLSTVIFVLTITGASLAGLNKVLDTATELAGKLGTQNCSQIPHGNGCVINWCYQGMFKGFEWKYMGVCTHPCTQEAEAVFYESRAGTVEHCLQNLMQKIAQHKGYENHNEL
ncbi:uncharacterized protein LOC132719241 [Ruditapes philippinarum]|uniref:uncharacterized protein LOC132719241 n=1 Tax=Ruditapes philippinarum TaxID=129788 RepID=UPI00295AE807|nr:uncharacterized protein LOC132719241 [Ruditapes philippinarum]